MRRGIAAAQPSHERGTVGWVDVRPNSRIVIPGRVTLTVDLRAAGMSEGGAR